MRHDARLVTIPGYYIDQQTTSPLMIHPPVTRLFVSFNARHLIDTIADDLD